MPNLPVLQGHWRLLEPKVDTVQLGDERWIGVTEWEPVPVYLLGILAPESYQPIRRRVAPTPKCETCHHFVHNNESKLVCGYSLPNRPQDGSGYCDLHPQAQEVTR